MRVGRCRAQPGSAWEESLLFPHFLHTDPCLRLQEDSWPFCEVYHLLGGILGSFRGRGVRARMGEKQACCSLSPAPRQGSPREKAARGRDPQPGIKGLHGDSPPVPQSLPKLWRGPGIPTLGECKEGWVWAASLVDHQGSPNPGYQLLPLPGDWTPKVFCLLFSLFPAILSFPPVPG